MFFDIENQIFAVDWISLMLLQVDNDCLVIMMKMQKCFLLKALSDSSS